MALSGSYTDQGTDAVYGTAYARIDPASIVIDFRNRSIEFDLHVFVSEGARTRGRAQVARRHMLIQGTDFLDTFGNPLVTLAYGYLKTLPEFAASKDV